ncbi:MAG: arsenate reductase/protein-tyrosine-phosphatase family protein [Acidimicrobiia bacterium]
MPPATILVVRTGNICRSPVAEAVARHVLSAHFEVSDLSTVGREVTSGGPHSLPGHPATAHMRRRQGPGEPA